MRGKFGAVLLSLAAGVLPAFGLINPKFTPIELTREAESIVEISLAAPEGDAAHGKLGQALKGKGPGGELSFGYGGSDMLARCIAYVLADPAATVPAEAGGAWGEPVELGKVSGQVYGTLAVDWQGDAKAGVWIMAEGGDLWGDLAEKNATARPMGTKSRVARRGLSSRMGKWRWSRGMGKLSAS